MKILLFGKDGQVGWELQRSLAPLGSLVSLSRHSDDYCGDLANGEGIAETIAQVRPDVIVNAAAYTAVDKAESDEATAMQINAEAVRVMAQAAAASGTLLIHYSTDYVFPGAGSAPWQEDDATGPLNVYGMSKLRGEQHIVASGCHHLIFRTSWVYAARGNNFAKVMLRLAAQRDHLNVVGDQIGAPTSAELIADVTAHAIVRTLKDVSCVGIYHLAASGHTSWADYARYVFSLSSQLDATAKTPVVAAIPSAEYPTPAARPINSRLDCTKLSAAFELALPEWKQGIARLMAELHGS